MCQDMILINLNKGKINTVGEDFCLRFVFLGKTGLKLT